MRRLAVLLLIVALAPGTWLRTSPAPFSDAQLLTFEAVALPGPAEQQAHLGPFALEGIWRVTSPNTNFGGYSTLLALGNGHFLTFSDRGYMLQFPAPGGPQEPPAFGQIFPRMGRLKTTRDAEAATRDPADGTIWIGWEGSNSISRHDPAMQLQARARPQAMRRWGANSGAEAMVRLADGRFIVLAEGFSRRLESVEHEALLFAGDPTRGAEPGRFTFAGPENFSPVDMAQMPDGRVLVLMRRAVWPMPFRFAGRIALADPAEIKAGGTWQARQVASLTSSLPVDNFEGIAIEPRKDGRLTVWLLSDDNDAASQSTLLWKLAVDPAHLH